MFDYHVIREHRQVRLTIVQQEPEVTQLINWDQPAFNCPVSGWRIKSHSCPQIQPESRTIYIKGDNVDKHSCRYDCRTSEDAITLAYLVMNSLNEFREYLKGNKSWSNPKKGHHLTKIFQ